MSKNEKSSEQIIEEAVNGVDEGNLSENSDEMDVLELTEEQLEAILEAYGGVEDLEPAEKIDRALFESRNIYLNGEITSDVVDQIVPMIHYYGLEDDKYEIPLEERHPINIYLSSVGGELLQGKNIVAAIEGSKTKVVTILQGSLGASMGMVIFLSGHERRMSRFSELMYHNLSAGLSGTFAEMKNQMEFYTNLQNQMDEYIVERTEIPMEKLKEYGERNLDWHLTFEECKKYKVFDTEI